MSQERLSQIESLYHRTREQDQTRQAAFLHEACAGDDALEQDVQSLLRQTDNAGNFMARPALELQAQAIFRNMPPLQTLQAGSELATYQVRSLIGCGGMGEVYEALDVRLDRTVALKVLPDAFAKDPDRIARFEREAKILAALNHPNIAVLHGLEDCEGRHFLVMEFVDGETLAERIAEGPIPIDEALTIAYQIADALEAAHEKGIIHRDLKPSNVKLASDGKVKLLDFGLAKALSGPREEDQRVTSITVTNAGIILGTASYMSPEQAKGKPVDRRADIWAFGVILYEMLTARTLFSAETVSETMALLMTKDPDFTALPANTPAGVVELLRRCLVREPRNRLRDVGEARVGLETSLEIVDGDGGLKETRSAATDRHRSRLTVALLIVIAAMVIPTFRYFRQGTPAAPSEVRMEINTPTTTEPFSFAVSPDGGYLAFVASNSDGRSALWIRPLNSLRAQVLRGTEGASYPFWSPDGVSIGFFADAKLKRIDIGASAPQVLAMTTTSRGGTWNRQGIIVFAPGTSDPLYKIPAAGGEPVAVTRLEKGQTSHRFPQFLPDGEHFVYFVGGEQSVYVGALGGAPPKRLVNSEAAAAVSPMGFLLSLRQGTLVAQRFDFSSFELSRDFDAVAEPVASNPIYSASAFSAAADILAYRTGGTAVLTRQLAWLDRSGNILSMVGDPDSGGLINVELSPDQKRVAVYRNIDNNMDVWLIDAIRGARTRFTFNLFQDMHAIWSPDGSRVVFESNGDGFSRSAALNLYQKAANGTGKDELLLASDAGKQPNDWSSDGRFLIYRTNVAETGYDLWILPMFGDKNPFPFLKTPFDERDGQFSPDGKWIAYDSNESGQHEIYVQPFPVPGMKYKISTDGGTQPRWNKNGKEIFYISPAGGMMAAPMNLSPDGQSLEARAPALLFPARIAAVPPVNKQQYAISADGQRFLVNLAADAPVTSPITLIYHWKPPKS